MKKRDEGVTLGRRLSLPHYNERTETMQSIMQGITTSAQRTQSAVQTPDRPLGITLLSISLGFTGGIYLLLLLLTLRLLTFWYQIIALLMAFPQSLIPPPLTSTSNIGTNTTYNCAGLGPSCVPGNTIPGALAL